MQFRRFTAVFVLAALSARRRGRGPASAGSAPAQLPERDFLSRIRRLTVEGRRAGEGYWSPDGQRLVFQSEREPGNPVLSDLRAGHGDRRDHARLARASARPPARSSIRETDDILFASTHHDPRSKQLQKEELEFRASGKERRYAWDYDPEMELYVRSEKTGALHAG